MRDDDFNTGNFRPALATEPTLTPSSVRSARRRRDQFVIVPLAWADRLDDARCAATLKIALHLLWKSFKDRRQTMRLANSMVALKGVTRGQKCRAIQELEALGLIKVEHRPRRSPVVTLLFVGGDDQ
jgi:hypothetical protein